jgi:hypothetical protein
MEPNVFLRYIVKGIVYVLNNFGDEQYPSNNVNPWCLIIQLMKVLVSLLVHKVM